MLKDCYQSYITLWIKAPPTHTTSIRPITTSAESGGNSKFLRFQLYSVISLSRSNHRHHHDTNNAINDISRIRMGRWVRNFLPYGLISLSMLKHHHHHHHHRHPHDTNNSIKLTGRTRKERGVSGFRSTSPRTYHGGKMDTNSSR